MTKQGAGQASSIACQGSITIWSQGLRGWVCLLHGGVVPAVWESRQIEGLVLPFHVSLLTWTLLQIVNPHLLKDLTERGLWNEEMKNQIIAHNGSIQVGQRTCVV